MPYSYQMTVSSKTTIKVLSLVTTDLTASLFTPTHNIHRWISFHATATWICMTHGYSILATTSPFPSSSTLSLSESLPSFPPCAAPNGSFLFFPSVKIDVGEISPSW